MRSMMEMMFVLMIVVGLSMIVYDVLRARTAARALELRNWQKNKSARSRRREKHRILGSMIKPVNFRLQSSGIKYSL